MGKASPWGAWSRFVWVSYQTLMTSIRQISLPSHFFRRQNNECYLLYYEQCGAYPSINQERLAPLYSADDVVGGYVHLTYSVFGWDSSTGSSKDTFLWQWTGLEICFSQYGDKFRQMWYRKTELFYSLLPNIGTFKYVKLRWHQIITKPQSTTYTHSILLFSPLHFITSHFSCINTSRIASNSIHTIAAVVVAIWRRRRRAVLLLLLLLGKVIQQQAQLLHGGTNHPTRIHKDIEE